MRSNFVPVEVSAVCLNLLEKAREELRLAGNELYRMENEGGINSCAGQLSEADAYIKSSHKINNILNTMIVHETEYGNDNSPVVKQRRKRKKLSAIVRLYRRKFLAPLYEDYTNHYQVLSRNLRKVHVDG